MADAMAEGLEPDTEEAELPDGASASGSARGETAEAAGDPAPAQPDGAEPGAAEGVAATPPASVGSALSGSSDRGPIAAEPEAQGAPGRAALPELQRQPHGSSCLCCSRLPGAQARETDAQLSGLAEPIAKLRGGGQPLPDKILCLFEQRFGQDFRAVRIHDDSQAAALATQLHARAFTVGTDIAFAPAQYQPDTAEGRHLLAHELTHVVQHGRDGQARAAGSGPASGTEPHVHRSLFGRIWNGIKKVGSAVWSGIKKAGGAIWDGLKWLGGKLTNLVRDGAMWLINLIRDLPERLGRLLVTLWEGLKGAVSFLPELITHVSKHGLKGLGPWVVGKLKSGGAWVAKLMLNLVDLVGLPELGEALLHVVSQVRPLRSDELLAGQRVLGPHAVRWGDVRVGSGELLTLIFRINSQRAFTTWHTINEPEGESVATMVHELTHVYQYEKVGTLYMAQALHAQSTRGADAYVYGDLAVQRAAGKQLRDFNREEQAQIAEDYYKGAVASSDLSGAQLAAFEQYIAELREGRI
jgi:hypothetical protein